LSWNKWKTAAFATLQQTADHAIEPGHHSIFTFCDRRTSFSNSLGSHRGFAEGARSGRIALFA
jgi:hypothetical protein